MFFAVLFALLFLIVIYLLIMPIVVCIDTLKNQYYIQLWGLAKASIEGHHEKLLRIKLKVTFFNFYFYPLEYKTPIKKKKTLKRNVKKKRIGVSVEKSIRILKSFKVKKILLDIDTGNCISNAKMYPVFAFLNQYSGNFNINFQGRNQLVLYIQNRPIHILKSFINF